MPVVPIAAAVGAAAAVVGTAATIKAQNRANKAAKQQYAYERQMSQNRSVRERRDAIRAARLTQGSLVQTANNQGASSTSAALGGQGSIQSQLNSNLSFLDTQSSLADKSGAASVARQGALTNAGNWAAVSNLGMTVFSMSGGVGAFGK